jgi:DNA-binding Lrp family transcriptional regulator
VPDRSLSRHALAAGHDGSTPRHAVHSYRRIGGTRGRCAGPAQPIPLAGRTRPDPGDLSIVTTRLDAIDWKILRELQADGRMTNVELARRVGISAPPCLRRVRALEEAGVIRGYRALLDEKLLGFDITVFAMVSLSGQSEADLLAFEKRVHDWPIVRECWMLSGEVDFLLKCVAPDLKTFQAFVIEDLTAAPNVDGVRTSLTLRPVKTDPVVPIG